MPGAAFEPPPAPRAEGAPGPGGQPGAPEPGPFAPETPPGAPPPTYQPPGAPPAYPPVQYGGGGGDYPIDFQADYPEAGVARWRPFIHGILLLPHFFVLLFLIIAAYFALIGAWFAVLITGRYPPGLFNFFAGIARWANRVTAYQYFMNEQYPPFSLGDEPQYPARSRFDYPPNGKIARWRPLVHWLLAFPHFIIISFLGIAEYIVIVVAFFAVLFTRRWPPGLFDFTVGLIRWRTRATAYGYAWMTEKYPPFSLES
jgi:hypothetical protein